MKSKPRMSKMATFKTCKSILDSTQTSKKGRYKPLQNFLDAQRHSVLITIHR